MNRLLHGSCQEVSESTWDERSFGRRGWFDADIDKKTARSRLEIKTLFYRIDFLCVSHPVQMSFVLPLHQTLI